MKLIIYTTSTGGVLRVRTAVDPVVEFDRLKAAGYIEEGAQPPDRDGAELRLHYLALVDVVEDFDFILGAPREAPPTSRADL